MDRLSSFERCWSSSLRLLMGLRRCLLQIDKTSLLETFGSSKIDLRNATGANVKADLRNATGVDTSKFA